MFSHWITSFQAGHSRRDPPRPDRSAAQTY